MKQRKVFITRSTHLMKSESSGRKDQKDKFRWRGWIIDAQAGQTVGRRLDSQNPDEKDSPK